MTVERHVGKANLPSGRPIELIDLPGTYSLAAVEPGRSGHPRRPAGAPGGRAPAGSDRHRRRRVQPRQPSAICLQLIALGRPTVVALNMIDLARRDGLELDASRLAEELGVPVIETVAVRKRAASRLCLKRWKASLTISVPCQAMHFRRPSRSISTAAPARSRNRQLSAKLPCGGSPTGSTRSCSILLPDRCCSRQSCSSCSRPSSLERRPCRRARSSGCRGGNWIGGVLPDGALRSLVVDGIFAGVSGDRLLCPRSRSCSCSSSFSKAAAIWSAPRSSWTG